MQELLARSMLDADPQAYIHPGDLAWWLGWPPKTSEQLERSVALWEDADGRLVAWGMLDGVDVGEWIDTRGEDQDTLWALLDAWLADRSGLRRYVRADDERGVRRLHAAGYVPTGEELPGFSVDLLTADLGEPDPRVRSVAADDVPGRASVTRAAFESFDRPYETYVEQYAAFMSSRAYPAGWDLVAWAEPGRAAACTIAWPDPISLVGNFEPVATHPDVHRQGYGSAVLREGMRRLAAAGMRRAIVRTGSDNAPAIGLYRSVGFRDDHVQLTFRLA
jgi:ribosomal protein S18 acetylase RimI-like enzyme